MKRLFRVSLPLCSLAVWLNARAASPDAQASPLLPALRAPEWIDTLVSDMKLFHDAPCAVTLPRFHVHQIVGNFLMNGELYGQERAGPEPAVHG